MDESRRPWTDGTTHLAFPPGAFLGRLAVLVPRPHVNLMLYHGVLAPRAAWRAEVVPSPRASSVDAEVGAARATTAAPSGRGRRWADLMRRVFDVDVLACACGGRLQRITVIEAADVTGRILRHLGLPEAVPPPGPSRAPPLDEPSSERAPQSGCTPVRPEVCTGRGRGGRRSPRLGRGRPRDRANLRCASGRRRDRVGGQRRITGVPSTATPARVAYPLADGDLVVEGGRRRAGNSGGPLIARLSFPPTWRCVVAIPETGHGVSGMDEEQAFEGLPPPPEREVEHVAHLVLMALLPALAEADIEVFGAALTEMQEVTGRWFASVQGGTFAPGARATLIRRLREWGASGVGQSSWGPAVYGIVDGVEAGACLADRVRGASDCPCAVYEGVFPLHGARVWRAGPLGSAGRAGVGLGRR